MTVRLPPEKCTDMIELCKEMLAAKKTTIRKFAQLIGKCVSAEVGVRNVAFYYKSMEVERDEALRMHRDNFDTVICISNESKLHSVVDYNNTETSLRPKCLPKPHRRI